MRRKLSAVEHMIDGNIVYLVSLEGSFHCGAALAQHSPRVQRKHPALRMLIHREPDGLYYEEDSATGDPPANRPTRVGRRLPTRVPN